MWRRTAIPKGRRVVPRVPISARRTLSSGERPGNTAVVWNDRGRLVGLAGRAPLCVNPLLGDVSEDDAPARLNLGAANATGLEWGARVHLHLGTGSNG